MAFRAIRFAIALGIASTLCPISAAQNDAAQDSTPVTSRALAAEYPSNRTGILIHGADWISISAQMPAKTHVKHGFAPALTSGIAPAAMVAEYEGIHAPVRIDTGQPVICICHVLSLPGNPVLVKLHPKKNVRELDAGKLHIGAKAAQAEAADLVTVTVSQPENGVWLVQPKQVLPDGEYALMLGVQNMSIFPFSVAEAKH